MVRFHTKRAQNSRESVPDEKRFDEKMENFLEVSARDVMTRRNEMISFDGSISLGCCMDRMLEHPYSRFPVYEETVDTVLGILNFKDAVKLYIKHPEYSDKLISDIPGLIREAAIVPETRPAQSIFKYMRAQNTSMMIVVDEYGQTSGLITKDDVMEEMAERLLEEENAADEYVLQMAGDSVVLDGMTPLDDAEEILGCDFGTDDFETLSGYLTSLLGHIPGPEDRNISGNGFLFHILKTEHYTIRKVRAERLPAEGKEE